MERGCRFPVFCRKLERETVYFSPAFQIRGRFWFDNRETFRKMPLLSGQAAQVSLDPAVGRTLAESPPACSDLGGSLPPACCGLSGH